MTMKNLGSAIFSSACILGGIYLIVNHYDEGWGWCFFFAFMGVCTFD